MSNSPKNQNKYIRAKERVEELKKFYTSLMWYVIIIPFLAWINYTTNGFSYVWFLWAAFGWGIGLVIHAIKAFRLSPVFNRDWEERKIREFMREEEFHENGGRQEEESWDDKINWDTDKNYNSGQRWE
ncbi:2TM domain-containing protein [Gilvibacter sp.]|uniref:2TM domain-containing protein n=1 Tax=Gilvibacter sp. TaxID=2729997 RepID=UPI003455AB04|nr:2TM domain-containing protein [Gilvibacter sp.]